MIAPYKFVLFAGPNGAGKTTFAKQWFQEEAGLFVYLNADEIGRKSQLSNVGAAREMLRLIDFHLEQRDDIMLETTLSGQGYARQIPEWRSLGYTITLYYLSLPDVDTAIRRVRERVLNGGHDIPEVDIRRRFERSRENFERFYRDAVDEWYVLGDQKVVRSGRR
jgi:predicted ABC-type ATPase